jgi:acetolactate synthase regulatory subunit
MSFYSVLSQRGPGLAEILQQARVTAMQKRQQNFAERQAKEQTKRYDAQIKRQDEQAVAERQADEVARQAKAATAALESKANEARYYENLFAANQSNPQMADRIAQAARTRGFEIGTLVDPQTMRQAEAVDVEIVDATTPEQAAMDLGAQAASVLGAPPASKSLADRQHESALYDKLTQEGLIPNTPEWHARARQLNQPARGGGVTVNMGGKPLPVEAVNYISDADAASMELGNLMTAYREIAPKSEAEAFWARAQAKIPGTAQWQYVKESEAVAQMYGLVREGGKLQASDFPRYHEQMPMPWDMPSSAERKTDVAERLLKSQTGKRREQYGAAGYKAPQPTGSRSPTDAEIDAEIAELEGAP